MSCQIKHKSSSKNLRCPHCDSSLYTKNKSLWFCTSCKVWLESIDFLTKEERECADKDCLKCDWLKKTPYKKNQTYLHYCNCMGKEAMKKPMEKIRDFRKCGDFKQKKIID